MRTGTSNRMNCTCVPYPRDGSPAEQIKELTNGRGADLTIEVSSSVRALNEAERATAYSARVVVLGFFQGKSRAYDSARNFTTTESDGFVR
jgi:threonine dehydrogenase-like Zn-dependent dehydrogenase